LALLLFPSRGEAAVTVTNPYGYYYYYYYYYPSYSPPSVRITRKDGTIIQVTDGRYAYGRDLNGVSFSIDIERGQLYLYREDMAVPIVQAYEKDGALWFRYSAEGAGYRLSTDYQLEY
jgi:hypothetical protein